MHIVARTAVASVVGLVIGLVGALWLLKVNSEKTTMQNMTTSGLQHISTMVFPSEDKLKDMFKDGEWQTITNSSKTFYIAKIPQLSYGISVNRIACWTDVYGNGSLVGVWDVTVREVGNIELEYNKDTSCLSVRATGTTTMKNKIVAFVILNALSK